MDKTLKEIGRPVLLAITVLGFIWFWPLGLALLALMAWSGMLGFSAVGAPWTGSFWSSGNSAFDKYIEEARAALDKERDAFEDFIKEKLNKKDQAEFAEFRGRKRK